MTLLIKKYASFVVLTHAVFALPFTITGYVLALHTGYAFQWMTLVLIVACTVTLRNAAMAFNRLIDAKIDKQNIRTTNRAIPQHTISPKGVKLFIITNVLLFIICTYFINSLCFQLSFVAIIVTLGYSYMKRFTSYTHFILGLGLSLAPIGAYIAVTASFATTPILLSLCVLLWVAGFDILYALQDMKFDKLNQLHSIPAKYGFKTAYMISISCEIIAILLLFYLGFREQALGILYWCGVVLFSSLILFQYTKVKSNRLDKIDQHFVLFNGLSSLLFGSCVAIDFFN